MHAVSEEILLFSFIIWCKITDAHVHVINGLYFIPFDNNISYCTEFIDQADDSWCSALLYSIKLCNKTHVVAHTHLGALCPGLPGWAGTRKVKPIWILLKQETVSGSGIRWAICKSAPCSRQTTTPAPHHSVFKGWMPTLPPNQQRQSTEGSDCKTI